MATKESHPAGMWPKSLQCLGGKKLCPLLRVTLPRDLHHGFAASRRLASRMEVCGFDVNEDIVLRQECVCKKGERWLRKYRGFGYVRKDWATAGGTQQTGPGSCQGLNRTACPISQSAAPRPASLVPRRSESMAEVGVNNTRAFLSGGKGRGSAGRLHRFMTQHTRLRTVRKYLRKECYARNGQGTSRRG